MKEDFSELVEYLDQKFQDTATKADLENLATKDSVVEISNRLITLEEKIENLATREDMNDLQKSVDAYAHKADKYFQEMAALTSKVDRLDKWIHEIADKVGVELRS